MSATAGRSGGHDSTLYNEDLAPIPRERRNWSWVNYTTVWMGMVHNIVAYETSANLLNQGFSPLQALIVVAVASAVLVAAMWINGVAGAKYGLPFPVLVRAVFGYPGARALVRGRWSAGAGPREYGIRRREDGVRGQGKVRAAYGIGPSTVRPSSRG